MAIRYHLTPFVYAGQLLSRPAGEMENTLFERLCYRLFMSVSGTMTIQQSRDRITVRPGGPKNGDGQAGEGLLRLVSSMDIRNLS